MIIVSTVTILLKEIPVPFTRRHKKKKNLQPQNIEGEVLLCGYRTTCSFLPIVTHGLLSPPGPFVTFTTLYTQTQTQTLVTECLYPRATYRYRQTWSLPHHQGTQDLGLTHPKLRSRVK